MSNKKTANPNSSLAHYYLMSMNPYRSQTFTKFSNIKSNSANRKLCGASRMTTLSSAIPVSVRIKNATFGVKQSFQQKNIQVHDTFCCICSNFPSPHGSPWRGGGRETMRRRGRRMGVTPYTVSVCWWERLRLIASSVCIIKSVVQTMFLLIVPKRRELVCYDFRNSGYHSMCWKLWMDWLNAFKQESKFTLSSFSRYRMQLARKHCSSQQERVRLVS